MSSSPAAADDWPITLKDHSDVHIRRLETDDYDAVVRLSEDLSDHERYQRFFIRHPSYLDDWARSLTEPGDQTQEALGAFEDDMLVGLASYNRTSQSACAEVSVLVAHEQHDRGLGTALLHILALVARRSGIHHLVADVLAENHSMQKVVADAGWSCSCRHDGDVVRYDVDLDQLD